ncbi:MAG: hypothetical protein RJA44_2296 [Pseudomonadota bacterium]
MNRPKPLQAVLMATPDETEAQFYEALQHADLEHLMAVWADDEEIACVHPGGGRLIGAAQIRASFEALFQHGAVEVRPLQVRRVRMPTCEVHHVVEQVRIEAGGEPQYGYLCATNVYVKTPAGWQLLLHHASPGSASELQDSGQPPAVLH